TSTWPSATRCPTRRSRKWCSRRRRRPDDRLRLPGGLLSGPGLSDFVAGILQLGLPEPVDATFQAARAAPDVNELDPRPHRHAAGFAEALVFQLQQHADARPVVRPGVFLEQAHALAQQVVDNASVAPLRRDIAAVVIDRLAQLCRPLRYGRAHRGNLTIPIT